MNTEENILIRNLEKNEEIPWDLLLLADPSKDMIDRYLDRSEIFIASLENNIIAEYVLYPITNDLIEIKNIAVDENHQGKGLGKLLLAHADLIAKSKGFKQICIGTSNASISQLQLYQRSGFELTELKKEFFTENYPEPLYENGIQCKHMIVLSKQL